MVLDFKVNVRLVVGTTINFFYANNPDFPVCDSRETLPGIEMPQ